MFISVGAQKSETKIIVSLSKSKEKYLIFLEVKEKAVFIHKDAWAHEMCPLLVVDKIDYR